MIDRLLPAALLIFASIIVAFSKVAGPPERVLTFLGVLATITAGLFMLWWIIQRLRGRR